MEDYNPPYYNTNPGKKSALQVPQLFFEDENIFQKSARAVQWGIEFPICTTRADFEKCSHLQGVIFEKKGGADAFENDLPSTIYEQRRSRLRDENF